MTRRAAAFALVLSVPALAAPPPDPDPTLAPWYRGLHVPGTGTSCCSIADCRNAESRIVGDHYEVLIDGKWLVVPPQLILDRNDNPTGQAVVCWTPTAGILCFVRGPEV